MEDDHERGNGNCKTELNNLQPERRSESRTTFTPREEIRGEFLVWYNFFRVLLIVFLYIGYSRGVEFYDFRVAGVRDRGYPGGFGAEFFHDVDVDVGGA